MKRFLLLLTGWLLWFSPHLQGQITMQYWFDGQYASRQEVVSSSTSWQPQIDVGYLSEGLHTLCLHVSDSSGRWSSPRQYVFYRAISYDSIHNEYDMGYSYWYDHDYGNRQTGTIGNGSLLLDVSQLREGLHTISMQIGQGRTAQLNEYVFFKMPTFDSLSYEYTMDYVYWYDHDFNNRQAGTIGNGSLLLDVSQLREGLHTISMQIGQGRTAQLNEYVFFKMPTFDSLSYEFTMDYVYWYDHDYSNRQTGTIGNGSLLLDVSHLAGGLHTICIQFGENRYAQLQQYVFYKAIQFDTLNDNFMQTYTYWYDRDYSTRQSGSIGNGALLLDVAQLSEGIHTISMQLGEGNRSQLQHYVFIRPFRNTLDSLYHITRYDYTLNGNEGQRHITQVTPCDTLQLVSLLPVDTLPIRSMCFHFNPNGGNPVLNAKNDIRFRFWTDGKRFAEYAMQYIDENVVDTVVADTIERGAVKTIAAPTNNSIHWFKLAAGTGDSLSFCTSKRCTIQLYAPSGEMLFMTSGDSVLSWVGCHAWEDGVYYLAVHDAEDTGNMTVSYQWVYKYAVLDYSPTVTSNVHSFCMVNLFGNGYDELFNVSLFNVDTSWVMDTMLVFNNNEALVEFYTNTDIPLDNYNMLLVFRDSIGVFDSLIVNSAIRVVSAEYGNVTVSYDYISSFVEPHIITLSITNTGNVPYMAVPIVIAHTEPSTASILFNNANLILDTSEFIDSLYFNAVNLFGQGVVAKYIPLMVSYIGAYETQTMRILYDCPRGEGFDFYAWAGRPWSVLNSPGYDSVFSEEQQSVRMFNGIQDDSSVFPMELRYNNASLSKTNQRKAQNNPLCGMPDPCSEASNIPEIGSLLECMCGLGVADIKVMSNAFLAQANKCYRERNRIYHNDTWRNYVSEEAPYQEIRIQTPSSLLREAVDHCWVDGIGRDEIMRLWDHLDGDDCPDPPTPIHPQVPSPPYDPNEIIGYKASSGSMAIAATQRALSYIVEFENDSLLAEGTAHVVVVKDTLDGSVFDLNSFSAVSFTIGDDVVNINGGRHFVLTKDMRPAVNVIVQVELDYHIDTSFAVATWTFSSLDPMTLQPTVADTLGFLMVGGTGEVSYTIDRKTNLLDSTIIDNRAWITFDNEEPISTSIWRNIVDITSPVSAINSVVFVDGAAIVDMHASDNLSGVWKYHVYGQLGVETWLPLAMNVSADTVAVVLAEPNQYMTLRTIAVDSAGNVEPLMVLPPPVVYDTLVATVCDSIVWRDSTYTISGVYLKSAPDSVFVLSLMVNHSTIVDSTAVACDSFSWRGTTYTSTGTPTYRTVNVSGCDSTIILHLTVNHSVVTSEVVTACDSWQGYAADTMLVTTATAANGCDSTHTVALTVNHSVATTEVVTVCDEWQGYTSDTVLTTTDTAANGCDSTHTIALTVNHNVETLITDTAEGCYTWHDNEYTESGTYVWQGTTADGCDSTVTLMLVIEQDVGIEVIGSQAQVSVYPNPTDGWLTIGSDMVVAVEVFDHAGRRVAVFNDANRIYLGDLPSGGYLLRIHLTDSMATQRVQLNK